MGTRGSPATLLLLLLLACQHGPLRAGPPGGGKPPSHHPAAGAARDRGTLGGGGAGQSAGLAGRGVKGTQCEHPWVPSKELPGFGQGVCSLSRWRMSCWGCSAGLLCPVSPGELHAHVLPAAFPRVLGGMGPVRLSGAKRWVRRELSSFTRACFTAWLCSVCLCVHPVHRGGRRPQRGARGLPCTTRSERMALGTPQQGGSSCWGAGGVVGHEGQQGPWWGPATLGMSPPSVPKSREQPWGTSLCHPCSLPGEQVASQDLLLSLQACSFFPSCTKILGCLAS